MKKKNKLLLTVDLLEIKAANKEKNNVLDRKIAVIKVKLSSYNVDLESIESAANARLSGNFS